MTSTTVEPDLDRLQRLDSQAIGAVFDRYYPDIYRYVRYRLSDEALAEDIASEVFVRLLEALQAGRGPQTSLKAWLLATAAHIVSDQFRQSYRHPVDDLPESLPDGLSGPGEDVEQREKAGRLKQAMRSLTEEQQHVLAMRFGQGYSLEETASMLKKNVNAIKQLQFRALAALQRGMGEMV